MIKKTNNLHDKKEIANYDNVIIDILPDLILYFYDKINDFSNFCTKYLDIISDEKNYYIYQVIMYLNIY